MDVTASTTAYPASFAEPIQLPALSRHDRGRVWQLLRDKEDSEHGDSIALARCNRSSKRNERIDVWRVAVARTASECTCTTSPSVPSSESGAPSGEATSALHPADHAESGVADQEENQDTHASCTEEHHDQDDQDDHQAHRDSRQDRIPNAVLCTDEFAHHFDHFGPPENRLYICSNCARLGAPSFFGESELTDDLMDCRRPLSLGQVLRNFSRRLSLTPGRRRDKKAAHLHKMELMRHTVPEHAQFDDNDDRREDARRPIKQSASHDSFVQNRKTKMKQMRAKTKERKKPTEPTTTVRHGASKGHSRSIDLDKVNEALIPGGTTANGPSDAGPRTQRDDRPRTFDGAADPADLPALDYGLSSRSRHSSGSHFTSPGRPRNAGRVVSGPQAGQGDLSSEFYYCSATGQFKSKQGFAWTYVCDITGREYTPPQCQCRGKLDENAAATTSCCRGIDSPLQELPNKVLNQLSPVEVSNGGGDGFDNVDGEDGEDGTHLDIFEALAIPNETGGLRINWPGDPRGKLAVKPAAEGISFDGVRGRGY